ncbi:alpha/beta hydrolase [Nocardia asteroides]|uniref:alpha/beta hydrolase n=1 Tax=Nocardia asteroides TaxID=1824 RepID=UPI00365BC5C8
MGSPERVTTPPRGAVKMNRMVIPKALVCGVVLVSALVTGGCGAAQRQASGPAAAELVAQADAVATPRIAWAPCAPPIRDLDCAVVPVPLDYANPTGPQLMLAVTRQPARDPERRIGTLFTAAGGPGGSGLEWAAKGELFSGELSERFDVVTFDQRGVGRSSAVRCFPDSAAQQEFWRTLALPPTDETQQRATEDASRRLAAGCERGDGALIAHLTTVDAARDLDLLRRAVGDRQLTYEGGSYATYLGIVYGTLFPDRVRALQLSSLIDPVAYTTDTRAHIAATAVGTEEVLAEFLRLCAAAGPSRCAFGATGASAAELRGRDSALLEQAKPAALPVGTGPDAVSVSYGELIQAHATLLYDPVRGWPALAVLLAQLELGPAGNPAVVREVLSAVTMSEDFLDSFVAISCADNSLPAQPGRWPEFAAQSDAPVFGPFWLYLRQPCATWPAPATGYPQRYTGPWTQHTTAPALLINNRFDPATPLSSAQRAAEALGSARLVVVTDGYGHEPAGPCVTTLRVHYLVDLHLPAPGTTCTTDRTPFTG